MITKFKCSCGNNNSKQTYEYDGMLGYEAIVCTVCGKYYDHTGEHPKDKWSKHYIKKNVDKL